MRTIDDPNLSVIVPGPCNGKCGFCFWKHEEVIDGYFKRLKNVLDSLPEQFNKISLTGGEPTISKYLPPILRVIGDRRDRWKKVVLTTNGTGLKPGSIEQFDGAVDHVNISRHSEWNKDNDKIFGAEMPSGDLIECRIARLNKMGIDVTANCVIQSDVQPRVSPFITWAKSVGFSSVCFRKQHSEGCDLSPTTQENDYTEYKHIAESSCPVCRTTTQLIHGIKVFWSLSIPEPSEGLDLIYEAVLHPDGTLSADWGKNIELELPTGGQTL